MGRSVVSLGADALAAHEGRLQKLAVAIFEYLKQVVQVENQSLRMIFPSECEIVFLITHFLMSTNSDYQQGDQKVFFT